MKSLQKIAKSVGLSPILSCGAFAMSLASLLVSRNALSNSVAARSDAFEPRIVVSAFIPLEIKRVDDPGGASFHHEYKSGTLSLKNTGKGDAWDIACHVVNPFSHPFSPHRSYAYHRFRSESWFMLLCAGDQTAEASKRSRPYDRVLSPGEEQEFCVQDLDLNPALFQSFFVVTCTYSDKEGTRKGGDDQIVELDGLLYPTAEEREPAETIWQRYQSNQWVRLHLQRTPQPLPKTLPAP